MLSLLLGAYMTMRLLIHVVLRNCKGFSKVCVQFYTVFSTTMSYRSVCWTTSLYFTFIFTDNFPRYRLLGRQFSSLILFCNSLIHCLLLFYFILFLNLKHCISFAKHQNESATGIHGLPILNPPPSSLPTPSLWVADLHSF